MLLLFSRGRRVRTKRSEAAGASKLELGWQVVVVDSLVEEVRRSQILRFSLSNRSKGLDSSGSRALVSCDLPSQCVCMRAYVLFLSDSYVRAGARRCLRLRLSRVCVLRVHILYSTREPHLLISNSIGPF